MNDLKDYLKHWTEKTNIELDKLLPSEDTRPTNLHKAMRYSIFAGGKRIRPVLCIAACEICGGNADVALKTACAIEILHTYTLIHDDLPAMDDDKLRRGKSTCHIAFDEATAILAGDALLTLAFETLSKIPNIGGRLALELAKNTGSQGVIGGQVVDIESEKKEPNAEIVEYIHMNKTAALIRAACVMGGICASATNEQINSLATYGEKIGLAFQITDDLLDETATVKQLGKDIGSDKKQGKMTWQAVYGVSEARRHANELIEKAKQSLQNLSNDKSILIEIANYIASRSR